MIDINKAYLPKHTPWYNGENPEWVLADGEGEVATFKKGEKRGQHTNPVHRCSVCGKTPVQIRANFPTELYGKTEVELETFPVHLCDKHEKMAEMSVEQLRDLKESDLD